MTALAKKEISHHVCPWWFAYTFDNALRRIVHRPAVLLGRLVKPGMTVLDVGSGMGHFSLGMARLVGPSGRVVSADIQQEMLHVLQRRALRSGLADRISPIRIDPDNLVLPEKVDFALAFWMVHETPDQPRFFRQIRETLNMGTSLLVAEPRFHVKAPDFEKTLESAAAAGLNLVDRPPVRFSRTALFHSP